jgi:hypothetical protein
MTEENITGDNVESTDPTKAGEILHSMGAEQTELTTGYYDLLNELQEQHELEADDHGYLQRIPDDDKADMLQRQKLEQATARRTEVVDELRAIAQARHEQLEARRGELHATLFSVPSEDALLRTTLASDEELEKLADAGIQAGSEGLIRAALNASIQRGRGEVTAKIFGAKPELEAAYREYQQIPADEVLERQTDPDRIERLVPEVDADRLRARPAVRPY